MGVSLCVGFQIITVAKYPGTNTYTGGGMKISNNRTYWGLDGGAIAVQSGWFSGHSTAFMHFNLGIGNVPENYSFIMQPTFQIVGPTNEEYPGQGICFPQVPLPANVTVKEGDNATIQVVENAKHGAALYNVRISHLPYQWCTTKWKDPWEDFNPDID